MSSDFRNLRRWNRIVAAAGIAIIIGLFAAAVFAVEILMIPAWLAIPALIVVSFLATHPLVRSQRRLVNRLHAANFRICPDCYYDLQSLPTSGRCPECGFDYHPDLLQHIWTLRLGPPT